MKRRFLSLLLLITVLAAAMIFTACDKDPAPTPTPSPAPTPTKYTVTFNVDGQTEAFSVESGKTVSEPAAPSKDGYSFLGWYTAENSKFDFSTAISSDITLFAKWDRIEFTATFKADGKTVGEVAFSSLSTSIENVPAVPEKNGYTGAWEAYTLGAGNITVNAVYTPIEYTATFKADSAVVGEVAFTVLTDSIAAPTIPEKPGYSASWESYTLGTDNITINAIYTPIEYSIIYRNNADGVTNTNKTTYTIESETFTIAPLTMDNYDFLGWFSDADLTIPADLTIENGSIGNITLYAKWNATEYTATFKADGAVVGTAKFTILTSTVSEPAIPEKPGYSASWESYTLGTDNITINAVYTPIEYTATFKADGAVVGTVKFTVLTNSISAPAIPSKNGYTGTWESYTLGASNITVNAIYTPIEYTATFKADGAVVGTVKFTVLTTSILAPAVPSKNGYTGAWESYTLGADNVTVNANYTAITYTITYVNPVSGVSNTNKTTYTVETPTFTLSTLAKDRYEFLGWYNDAEFTNAAGTVEKGTTGNITLYAKWKCVHNYDASVTSESGILTDGVTVYSCGKCTDIYTVTIPATKSIKLLAIGNSFSVDALEHLYGILKDAGVEDITIANLYYGGCSLDTHWRFISGNSAEYTFYVSNSSTMRMVADTTKRTAQYGINYADWDIITVQQNSGNSGKPSSLGNLQNVIDFVKENAPDAKIYWHMTWAYASHYSGLSSYGNNQLTMYNAIISTVNEKIINHPDIAGIIPSGTAIQNLRTSSLGNDLTRDGFHLSYGTGRYTAALTWLAIITGYDIEKITWTPTYESSKTGDIAGNLPLIKEAVANAIKSPFAVTNASGAVTPDTDPDKPLVNTTLSNLTDEDKQYLTSQGYDPDDYMLLDLEFSANHFYNSIYSSALSTGNSSNNLIDKYICTQIFSRTELVAGSIIRINSGYKYRPDAWITLDTKNTSATRPGEVSTSLVVIDNSWWGDFNYRGFNIAKTSGTISLSNSDAFKIYVPVAKTDELTQADKDYLTSLGLNPNEYRALAAKHFYNEYYNSQISSSHGNANAANNNKFICLELLSRYDLTKGSVITIKSGFQYRPEVWYDLDDKTTAQTRPANVTTPSVTVTDEWWGNNSYCGINISKTPSAVLEESDVDALRIYVKIS